MNIEKQELLEQIRKTARALRIFLLKLNCNKCYGDFLVFLDDCLYKIEFQDLWNFETDALEIVRYCSNTIQIFNTLLSCRDIFELILNDKAYPNTVLIEKFDYQIPLIQKLLKEIENIL